MRQKYSPVFLCFEYFSNIEIECLVKSFPR
jgi:hypothetical protein